MWHLDTNHKLVRWHFVTTGIVDGFSRLVVSLKCTDNNRAETILACFLEAVQTRVRSDKGMENASVADFMLVKGGQKGEV